LERITIKHIICENCEGYYELKPDESLEDFESCECGGILRYLEQVEDLMVADTESVREIVHNGKTYTEHMVSNYNNGMIAGGIMGLIGLLGLIIGYNFLVILLFLGILLSFLSYNKNKNWVKGAEGEMMVSKYLNELSRDYIILIDLKLPGYYGNVDHVVLGPTGIFVIETKNFNGSYIIDGDQWLYGSASNNKKAYWNPGDQIKDNSDALSKFLSSKGMTPLKTSKFAVVAFINPNLTIRNKPKQYDVMHPSNLQNFIMSRKSKINEDDIIRAFNILKPYSAEISYHSDYF
jgi:hypothetical protein